MVIPVILSGGAGTRLWPVSRESHPKPFITLADGQSLLQKTFLRACVVDHVEEIITITNKAYYLKTVLDYDKIAATRPVPTHRFLLEPVSRNTAPAIALAALKIFRDHGPEAILLALPADHLIPDEVAFSEACKTGFALARQGQLVAFGIRPTAAETGFGYIEYEQSSSCGKAHRVLRFIEKPSPALAEAYVRSGRYFWNVGIFCFKAGVFLKQLQTHAPELLDAAIHCFEVSEKNKQQSSVLEFDQDCFSQLQNISIDYALMEKASDISVVACDFAWLDLGSWEAYRKLYAADEKGNTFLGEVLALDSKNNFIQAKNRVIAAIHIENLLIIDTEDALLIANRDGAQQVNQVVQQLKLKEHACYLQHRTVVRPWGSYTVLEESACFKVKRLVLKPQAAISLQSHQHRSEHWVVVDGRARVTIGEEDYDLQRSEAAFVPAQVIHRLANPGTSDLIVIETQTGSYLGEDDIIRYEGAVHASMEEVL